MAHTPARRADVLVHGDCWQGNTVWRGDAFVGFVDWDASGIGQPGLDLGTLRFDVALYFDLDATDVVTTGWSTAAEPVDHLPCWDLLAALSSPPDLSTWIATVRSPGRGDLDTPTITRRRDAFVAAALRSAGA